MRNKKIKPEYVLFGIVIAATFSISSVADKVPASALAFLVKVYAVLMLVAAAYVCIASVARKASRRKW